MKCSDFAGSWFTVFVLSLATLFVATRPAQAQTETVLYSFTGSPDGADPFSGLTSDRAGNLYGTTQYGGYGYGTVFELSPNGSGGWNETVLYAFSGDGRTPNGPVIFDSAGNLYCTAEYGGVYGYGVVFELSPGGGTSWQETVLYSFTGGTDGGYPVSGLIFDPAGNLYGTSMRGVFELSPSGGGWTEQVIYTGGSISGGLTMDTAGNIFGVAAPVVYELSPNGNGGWNSIVIYIFPGHHRYYGTSTPALDKAGNLYGVTSWHGGAGEVYRLGAGKKGLTEKTLYRVKKGGYLSLGIVFDAAGNIYGASGVGGTYRAGTIFELVPSVGKGKYQEKVLWTFDITDGYLPVGSLILDNAGNIYGTTYAGGSNGWGVVFELTP